MVEFLHFIRSAKTATCDITPDNMIYQKARQSIDLED